MREALLAAVAASMLFSGSASAQGVRDMIPRDPGRDAVQPGMYVEIAETSCTGGFIFDGTGLQAGRHYLGLAAHCVEDQIGAPVRDEQGRVFGKVAFSMWPYTTYLDDFAFVEIDTASYKLVDPALAGHPGIPTGVLPANAGLPGDRVQFSGWGFATESRTQTREQRPALLKSHTDRYWSAEAVVSNTDSGGPVVHLPTGGAMGSVSNFCVPLPLDHAGDFDPGCTAWGPSIAGIIEAGAQKGFTVDVRAAAEGAPPVPAPPAAQQPAQQPASPAGQPSSKPKKSRAKQKNKKACAKRKARKAKRCKRRR
jgi:hypothetical protein